MAKTITSPGIQITEKDLSLRSVPAADMGTQVLLPGFASQGPTNEPLMITTMSEFEAIYGKPATPAEKYFYYSAREILNSPASLYTVRLPYGSGDGEGFASSYSALLYPMTSAAGVFEIGAPKHISLSPTQYAQIIEGSLQWGNIATLSGEADYVSGTATAGLIVLNDLQTTVNEVAEGYYIGFADNSAVSATSPNFESIVTFTTLTGDNLYGNISPDRIDFSLSATSAQSTQGITSVSEQLEKVGFVGFETSEYQDHLSFGVFKVRKSTSDGTLLSIGSTERYLGSVDFNRRKVSPSGGLLSNAYIEDVINAASPTIKVFVNPKVSQDHKWTINSPYPTSSIRVGSGAKGLYPLGVYVPDSRDFTTNKVVGAVPAKLEKTFRLIDSPETILLDVVVDGGLTTIYANTEALSETVFNDETNLNTGVDDTYVSYWQSVANSFVNFCENARRDCMTILDIPRPVVVSGKDVKVATAIGKTFTVDIYNPLKKIAGSIESNYAALYGNWSKTVDIQTGRQFWIPFSGIAAAVYSRNDEVAQPWAAPAGLNRGIFRTTDIAFNPNQKQRDRLYEISVNPVVFFTGEGYSVMGQKTLQKKPTAFDRVNVRRLFLALERAVQRTLKYFVFEPNTEATRTRLFNSIEPIFAFAKQTEGLYDFLIVCDDRNNTPETIDNNQLIVDIYIKPVRTAEFILVNFIATRTGQDFSELI